MINLSIHTLLAWLYLLHFAHLFNYAVVRALEYISETTQLLEVRLKDHCTTCDNMTKARAFTRQQRKSTQVENFKVVIVEYFTTENHTLDWENARKIEQVPDWRIRGKRRPLLSEALLTTFTSLKEKDIQFLMYGTLSISPHHARPFSNS